MNINLPTGMFKNVPPRAWAFISLGIMALLILLGMTIYKYGGFFIKIERTAKEEAAAELRIEKDKFRLEQGLPPGTKVKKTADGFEILKGGTPE